MELSAAASKITLVNAAGFFFASSTCPVTVVVVILARSCKEKREASRRDG
jgi:hypothetical protein